MAALTGTRSTAKKGNQVVIDQFSLPVEASTKIYQGALVAINANGRAIPASSALAGQQCIGRAAALADNSGGTAGAITVALEAGVFKYANGAGGDAIAAANFGADCWAIDDQTVGLTDGYGGARARAGKILDVDADGGIWVMVGILARDAGNNNGAGAQAGSIISIPVDLASIAAGQVVGAFTPGFAGRIVKVQFVTTKPATTASKAATLQPRVNGIALTGGAIALTSANCTPDGNVVAGTAVTAGGAFTASQTIDVQASSVTAFLEGQGVLLLTLA